MIVAEWLSCQSCSFLSKVQTPRWTKFFAFLFFSIKFIYFSYLTMAIMIGSVKMFKTKFKFAMCALYKYNIIAISDLTIFVHDAETIFNRCKCSSLSIRIITSICPTLNKEFFKFFGNPVDKSFPTFEYTD